MALLAEGACDRAARCDPSRDRPCPNAGACERADHRGADRGTRASRMKREKRGTAAADGDAVRTRAPSRVDNPAERRDEPRAVRHMVHVPERVGQEIDAPWARK